MRNRNWSNGLSETRNLSLRLHNFTLASRSNRFWGQIVDWFIGAVPMLVGVGLMAIQEMLGAFVIGLGVLWSIFYYFLADGLSDGQSYGKRMVGTRVVHAETGLPCTFMQSFIRNFLLAALGPIDWIFIFGEKHQRLGDKAATTIVVNE